MQTNATGSTASTATSGGGSAPKAATKELGKDQFLQLLTAQLQNQDPLQPVDNQAFIAQLAQFSSLEQMQNVATKLDTLLAAAASQNQLSTASLVGKEVLFRTDGFDLAAGASPTLQGSVATAATVTATIQDASGRTVRTLALGPQKAGSFSIAWDGHAEGGSTLPPGRYTLRLSGKGADGADVAVDARANGRVQGVTFDGSDARLLVGSTSVKLSDVVQITQPPQQS